MSITFTQSEIRVKQGSAEYPVAGSYQIPRQH
jgi:hypothetical protein